MIKCDSCGKPFRASDRNARIIFSSSLSGACCKAYLCGRCGSNKRIVDRVQQENDWKLDVMDGAMDLDTFKEKMKKEGG